MANPDTTDYSAPWYHGASHRLTQLRAGSWVTQFGELAKAFSHRPSLISLADDCAQVKHDGKQPGFLFVIAETVSPEDVAYLRDTAQTHWQTQRDLRLRLVAELALDDPPQLSDEEIATLRQSIPEDSTGFGGEPDRGP